jgi:hypothetical protein
VITHYMNCWVAALEEMETSSALNVRKCTFANLFVFLVYAAIVISGFINDWPRSLRGTCGLIGMFTFRPFVERLRSLEENELIFVQIVGLVLLLFVIYCTRLLFTLLQLVSIILRNTAETWNLKFALRFSQCESDNWLNVESKLTISCVFYLM